MSANYVDPATLQIIIVIMIIVVFAGIITIYSIYYVSMAQRVQEFGKLKAIGATKKTDKTDCIARRHVRCVVCNTAGIVIWNADDKSHFLILFTNMLGGQKRRSGDSDRSHNKKEIIAEHKIAFFHWWIYLLAIGVTVVTVFLSLLKPMKMASGISIIEAMRFQGNNGKTLKSRKGYDEISVGKLAKNNIFSNKKKRA